MSVPRLSICIATYNRADIIGETLESIISQATDEIEIIVVDGASPDKTEAVVRRYQERCHQLQYHRLPVKGGVDRDYCNAVSFAKGGYCWLMTDDDIVKPGAINKILSLLPHKYSLLVVNAEVRDRTLLNLVERRRLHIDCDAFYPPESLESLFIDTAAYLTFIGAVIIDRDLWNERIKETYIGTEFIHVGVIFQKSLPRGACIIAEPYISIRYGNAQWATRQFEIWMIKWPNLIWSFSDISSTAKARICARAPWSNLQALLLQRAYGSYSLNEFRRFIETRSNSRWKHLIAKAVAVIPGMIANALAVAIYSTVARHELILYNLKTSPFYWRQYFGR
jgi:abequosyltransferase